MSPGNKYPLLLAWLLAAHVGILSATAAGAGNLSLTGHILDSQSGVPVSGEVITVIDTQMVGGLSPLGHPIRPTGVGACLSPGVS